MAEKRRSSVTDPAERGLVITRVFNAPRELVFKAWSECERLMQWWGPKGCTMRVCKIDFRPGGVFHYCLRVPNGGDLWGKFVYREIVRPERIVFINSFSDEEGNVVRNPWNPNWPLEVLSTLTFSEHEGRTTLTLRAVPHSATESEHKTFEAGFDSLQQGFKGTLDQLAEYLASQSGGSR